MSKAAIRGVVLLGVVFLAGVLGGLALDRVVVAKKAPPPGLSLKVPDVLDQLDLSTAQRQMADSILQRSSPRSEAMMRELVPRFRAIADSVNAELAALLTVRQRAKLDSLTRGSVFVIKKRSPSGKERVDTVRSR